MEFAMKKNCCKCGTNNKKLCQNLLENLVATEFAMKKKKKKPRCKVCNGIWNEWQNGYNFLKLINLQKKKNFAIEKNSIAHRVIEHCSELIAPEFSL